MPPKVKYTKDEIGSAAFELVREKGIDYLTARNLAARLGTSTAPIFTAFSSIDEVREFVKNRAQKLFWEYLQEGFSSEIPFKGSGMKYIQFACDERELFKFLFMMPVKDMEKTGYFPGENVVSEAVLDKVLYNYASSEENARKLYNHLSVYVHGIASTFAQGNSPFTMEDASSMVSEVFSALKEKMK